MPSLVAGFPIAQYDGTNLAQRVLAVTVPGGLNNSALVLMTTHENASDATGITNANFNGDALAKLASDHPTTWSRAEVWLLLNPDAGTFNLTVNKGGAANHWGIAVYVLENVDPSTPNRAPLGLAHSDSAAASSLDMAAIAGAQASDLIIDVLAIDSTGHAAVVGADQTQGYGPLNYGGGTSEGQGSRQPGTPDGVMSWTWTTAAPFTHIAVALVDGSAPPPPPGPNRSGATVLAGAARALQRAIPRKLPSGWRQTPNSIRDGMASRTQRHARGPSTVFLGDPAAAAVSNPTTASSVSGGALVGSAGFKAASGSSSVSSGARATASASKQANSSSSATAGPRVSTSAGRSASSASSVRAGGQVVSSGRKSSSEQSAVRAGARVTAAAAKSSASVSSVRAGARVTSTASKSSTASSSVGAGARAVATGRKGSSNVSPVQAGGRVSSTGSKQASSGSAVRGGARVDTQTTAAPPSIGSSSTVGAGGTIRTSGFKGAQRAAGVQGGARASTTGRTSRAGASALSCGAVVSSAGRKGTVAVSSVTGGGMVASAKPAVSIPHLEHDDGSPSSNDGTAGPSEQRDNRTGAGAMIDLQGTVIQ